ncbi:hypothetical protein EJB05_18940, partial [Eragrostis curvula]
MDLRGSIKGKGNAKHLFNSLDTVGHRPCGVNEMHDRDTCIHCYSPGVTILCSCFFFHCDLQCQFSLLLCTGGTPTTSRPMYGSPVITARHEKLELLLMKSNIWYLYCSPQIDVVGNSYLKIVFPYFTCFKGRFCNKGKKVSGTSFGGKGRL